MNEINILILYGSTTGNSEKVAFFCHNIINKPRYKVAILNVADITDSYAINQYNLVIICTSTWGVEPAVLQDDFEIFWFRTLNKKSISGTQFVIFALGDDYYPHFAYAAQILEEEITKNNGILANPSMKIQDPWEDSKNAISSYLKIVLDNIVL